eukprot:4201477-Pleurochrysis_carterae.AAC.1
MTEWKKRDSEGEGCNLSPGNGKTGVSRARKVGGSRERGARENDEEGDEVKEKRNEGMGPNGREDKQTRWGLNGRDKSQSGYMSGYTPLGVSTSPIEMARPSPYPSPRVPAPFGTTCDGVKVYWSWSVTLGVGGEGGVDGGKRGQGSVGASHPWNA